MKKIQLLGVLFTVSAAYAQSTSENYILSKTCLSGDCIKKTETVTYFDGLGRAKQIIEVKATATGKDLVTPITYDAYGRQTKDILPVPANSLNAAIHTGIINENTANSYYGVANAYAEKEIENSPLDKVLQQAHPGDAWKMGGGHTAQYKYQVNGSGEIKKFTTNTATNTVGTISNTVSSIPTVGFYNPGVLYKNTVTDEDGTPVIQFTNGRGQVLLIRRTDGTQNVDTYYVYNEYGQQVFVIPPKAVQQIEQNNNTVTQNILETLCYQYRYDGKGRQVEKRLPGRGDWESVVYDGADRPILSQDVNLKNKGQWLLSKYDRLNRIVYTGILSGGSRIDMQSQIGDQIINEETIVGGFTKNGQLVYYTNNFLQNFSTILTVNYYDFYPRDQKEPIPSKILDQFVITSSKSLNGGINTLTLPTATYVKNIEDDSWTKTYFYYDTKGRKIGERSWNHLGGYTKTESKLDFSGKPLETYTYHLKSLGSTIVTIKETLIYDGQNRLLKHYHQVNTQPEELLAENTYNDVGQLINKKTGNTTGTPLESIDYNYNIRGWLTRVNDLTNLNGKLFAYEIKYQNPFYSNVSAGKYNGNIAEMDWISADNGKLRRYNYQYDSLERLKNGIYSEPNTTVPQNNYYNETLSYDLNGNILNLKRNRFIENLGVELMDNLNYIYTGNRLNKVDDISGNYGGYPSFSGNPITYDSNGNMTSQIDKGMLQIDYNYLNLPNYIKFDQEYESHDGVTTHFVNTKYFYKADGTKLTKIHTYGSGRSNMETTDVTDYLNGFQYTNNELSFAPTSEGYFDFKKNTYIYQYKDLVGNIRLAYYKGTGGSPVVDRTTHFYPFGLEFGGELNTFNSITSDYSYSSQGQEKQRETGWSSYRWRNYDSALGRFFNVDPLSEKYSTWSPYAFSGNRVVDARELEGLEPLEINKTTRNLIIVNQGYVGNPLKGATQAQNHAKTNKDGGIDYDGIGVINNLNSAKNQVGVFASSSGKETKADILSSITAFRKQSPNGKLIMVGHSMGADNLVELANENPNIKIDLLFTLDIADDPTKGFDDDKIPSNVKTAINYYNKNDGFMGMGIGGEDIEAKDPSKTKILNVPVNASHTQIDNKYKYNAYNAVVKELNKPDKKKD
ncbi:RHS repeat-associated core domain-containing protein [Chryseobacterium sp. G0162]|uniref:DUF6443 domain-containing protein n=1 Tax=Chryseobacterium sp. G0162 TaxID=2487063 RepID=UPI000F4FF227|nr:DUF6443 domain-containing protein [Chryseobacterium sp. G0162]AZB10910.1 RHS repeat-associated core domain-containing protein [Chryseobacterium sp. G0162]